jgi:hypothetical protein
VTKKIVLFSDGTGNSSAKAQKTNVWRLFRALDQTTIDRAMRASRFIFVRRKMEIDVW